MRVWFLVGLLGCRWNFDALGGDDATVDARPNDGAGADMSDGASPIRRIYAVTHTQLFQIDPASLDATLVKPLCTNLPTFQVADAAIALDGSIVVSDLASTAFQRADASGTCTLVKNLSVRLFAMEYVLPGVLGPDEVLLGAGDDQNLYRVDPSNGDMQLIGAIGFPTGDLAWTGNELLISAQVGATFHLGRVDLGTGAASGIGDTGIDKMYGIAWRAGALYGFASPNLALEIDPMTGTPLRMISTSRDWSGATSGP